MKRTTISTLLVSIMLLTVFITATYAMSPDKNARHDVMAAANQLYETGHYAQAAQLYEQLLEQGVEDSAVFYNLGNSYYQQGQVVAAIQNFQHASQLAPRDADIKANLELALSQASFVPPSPADFGRIGRIASLTDSLVTLDELAMLALGFWFMLGILIFVWRSLQPGSGQNIVRYATVIMFVLVLLSVVALGSRAAVSSTQQAIFNNATQFAEMIGLGA